MVKLALTMFCPWTLTDISTVTWSGTEQGVQGEKDKRAGGSTDTSGCAIRTPPCLRVHHLRAPISRPRGPDCEVRTLVGREGRELILGQEVAVGDLVAEGWARDPSHCADAVAIVTGHLHAAEAGQAPRDLQDHTLEARDA